MKVTVLIYSAITAYSCLYVAFALICYVSLPGGIVLQQLLDWVKLHFTEGDVKARNVLMAEALETNDEYWSAVSTLINVHLLTYRSTSSMLGALHVWNFPIKYLFYD